MRLTILIGTALLIAGGLFAEGRGDFIHWSGGDDQRLCVGGNGHCGPTLIIERTKYGTGGGEAVAP